MSVHVKGQQRETSAPNIFSHPNEHRSEAVCRPKLHSFLAGGECLAATAAGSYTGAFSTSGAGILCAMA